MTKPNITQQIEKRKQEIEKGCGKDTEFIHGLNETIPWKCGEGKPDYDVFLCPECQAELKGIEFVEKLVEQGVEKLNEDIRKVDSNKICSDNACNYDLIINEIKNIFGGKK